MFHGNAGKCMIEGNAATPTPRSELAFTGTGFQFPTLKVVVRIRNCVRALRVDGNGRVGADVATQIKRICNEGEDIDKL